MSYDMGIGEESFNYTYNVSKMWYGCYPEKGIREHYGLSGEEAIPVLRRLREDMEDHSEQNIELEPANGWGSYEGALNFVSSLIGASIRNKDEVWSGD